MREAVSCTILQKKPVLLRSYLPLKKLKLFQRKLDRSGLAPTCKGSKDKFVIDDQILTISDDEPKRIIASWSNLLTRGQISTGELYESVALVAARRTQPRLEYFETELNDLSVALVWAVGYAGCI